MIANTTNFPLRMEPAADLEICRAFLQTADYTQPALCAGLKIGNMGDLGRVDWEALGVDALPPALRWCIQVFARGLATEERAARDICGQEVLAAMLRTGLLRPSQKNDGRLVCPVWLYPVEHFLVASDRRDDPDGGVFKPAVDVVFPAIYAGTLRFLELLPETPYAEVLDLCGGSGIGALHLSRTARMCVTADLAERSARFAEFNARLNNIPMESLCGDLYAPVQGRQFDFISAHPPFVPETADAMIYRDGGETGEAVTRRVVEGLPGHLRRGGTAMVLCVACDREQSTFEQNAREWLGEARDEFDIVFGLEKVLKVGEVVASIGNQGRQAGDEAKRQLLGRLHKVGVKQFVYGALFFRRHGFPPGSPPVRVRLTPEGGAADFEQLLAWRHFQRRPDMVEWLAAARPKPAQALELTVKYLATEGELQPAEFVFSLESGFAAALRPDAWLGPLVARLNGKQTVREVFEGAQAANELPAGFDLQSFTALVRRMVDLGLLILPERTGAIRLES